MIVVMCYICKVCNIKFCCKNHLISVIADLQ
jgi:hypothetical protein